MLTIGTIDLCSMLFLQESIKLAAYEGARRGVGRGRTNADVVNRVTEFLDERNVQYNAGSVVSFSSTDFNNADQLENVRPPLPCPPLETY